MKDIRTVENSALGLSDQEILEWEFIVGALFAERQRRLAAGC